MDSRVAEEYFSTERLVDFFRLVFGKKAGFFLLICRT